MIQREKKTSFKTHYYIEAEMENFLKREITFLCLLVVGIIVALIPISTADEGESTTFWILMLLFLIGLGVWTIYLLSQVGKIAGNINQCYYEIKDTYVCGYALINAEVQGDGAYKLNIDDSEESVMVTEEKMRMMQARDY